MGLLLPGHVALGQLRALIRQQAVLSWKTNVFPGTTTGQGSHLPARNAWQQQAQEDNLAQESPALGISEVGWEFAAL